MAPRKSKISYSVGGALLQFIILCIASALLFVVVFIIRLTDQAQAISSNRGHLSAILTFDVSKTLTVVSALQGLLTSVLTVALAQAFSYIQWAYVGSPRGASYIRALATSPSTSAWGTMHLILHKSVALSARGWGLGRLFLTVIVWLGGVVLFFQTSLVTVFDTGRTYAVTAGVGPFNASYVGPFFENLMSLAPGYPFSVLPYSYYGQMHNLVTNSFFATTAEPLHCHHPVTDDEREGGNDGIGHCSAYLFSGGVVGATPWVPPRYPNHPHVLIKNVPMMHIEFDTAPESRTAMLEEPSACQVFGSNTTIIAVKFCLAQSGPSQMDAGIYVCERGISQDGKCRLSVQDSESGQAPNFTTTISFHRRLGDVLSAKSNLTILSVTNLTDFPEQPTLSDADFQSYRRVLSWLLDYSSADIPAPSSLVESFWSASNQIRQTDTSSSAILAREFHSILAFPLWLFNANNYGNAGLQERVIQEDLPPEFYTTASLVRPYTKIKFADSMLSMFVAMEGIALLFGWFVLGWVIPVFILSAMGKIGVPIKERGQMDNDYRGFFPVISSFPLFDAQFKAQPCTQAEVTPLANGDGDRGECGRFWQFNDRQILESMSEARVRRKMA